MKVILAFDSYKECVTAHEACHAAAQAIHEAHPQAHTVCIPLSDGGEGLVQCLSRHIPLQWVEAPAHDAMMNPIRAPYAITADGTTAYMEMAAACGLQLIPASQRDAIRATTYGVGEMILDAHSRGCTRIVMGIGGSATTDAGQGMIQCLTDAGTPLHHIQITVACDVSNPLYGPQGAAHIYAPQKGATPAQVEMLDSRLRDFARHAEQHWGTAPCMAQHPGAGAAGGLGYGLMAFMRATLCPGIDIVLDALQFDRTIEGATCIITGEGRSDRQTLMGKVPHGVLQRARQAHVPVHLLSGSIQDAPTLLSAGFASVHSINQGDSRPLSILMQPSVALQNLRQSVLRLMHNSN